MGVHFSIQLELWNQIQYDKIIHLDSDVIVMKSMDGLFHITDDRTIAGVRDVTNPLNNGLVVLSPSTEIYKELLEFWKNAKWTCHGVNGFDSVVRPYFSARKKCQNADWNAAPQGVYPAFFSRPGYNYVKLSNVYNFVVSQF